MSATITWSPVNEQVLSVGSPSSVIESLTKVFGSLPIELGDKDIDKLLVMSHMWNHANDPYMTLIDAITEYGTINVKATY
jgi:hypothetical protein